MILDFVPLIVDKRVWRFADKKGSYINSSFIEVNLFESLICCSDNALTIQVLF